MYQLAMAFKKYEVTDVDCQLYVACEAAQVQEDAIEAENVLTDIARGVKPLMRSVISFCRRDFSKSRDRWAWNVARVFTLR